MPDEKKRCSICGKPFHGNEPLSDEKGNQFHKKCFIEDGIRRRNQSANPAVLEAADCPPCPDCGEPYCVVHEMHYAECPCPGPHS